MTSAMPDKVVKERHYKEVQKIVSLAQKETKNVDLFQIPCPAHRLPSLLKVSERSGRVFLMCKDEATPCYDFLLDGFRVEECQKHDQMITLKFSHTKHDKDLYYIRCGAYVKDKKNKWCHKIVREHPAASGKRSAASAAPEQAEDRSISPSTIAEQLNNLSLNEDKGPKNLANRESRITDLNSKLTSKEQAGVLKLDDIKTETGKHGVSNNARNGETDQSKIDEKASRKSLDYLKPESKYRIRKKSMEQTTKPERTASEQVDVRSEPVQEFITAEIQEINTNIHKTQKLMQTYGNQGGNNKLLEYIKKQEQLKQDIIQRINQERKLKQEQTNTTVKYEPGETTSSVKDEPGEVTTGEDVRKKTGVQTCQPLNLTIKQYREEFKTKPANTTQFRGTQSATDRSYTATVETTVENINREMSTRPDDTDTSIHTPTGLNIQLLPHQKSALNWLLWRERAVHTPPGGILADDMGLGKTFTMISLIFQTHTRESCPSIGADASEWKNSNENIKHIDSNSTLIIVPASVLHQWNDEFKKRTDRRLKIIIYHGKDRTTSYRKLAESDVVLTTYNLVQIDLPCEDLLADSRSRQRAFSDKQDQIMTNFGPLGRVKWRRVILDEAHQIKNPQAKTTLSICRLCCSHRWALTGTPIQNNMTDLYSLVKFLRFKPFDDINTWKHWIENCKDTGMSRLDIVTNLILLRRTKKQLKLNSSLDCLPMRRVHTHHIILGDVEKEFYDQMFNKYQEVMRRLIDPKIKTKASDNILVMILRLRQACCSPQLTNMPLVKQETDEDLSGLDDLISNLENLSLKSLAATSTREDSKELPQGALSLSPKPVQISSTTISSKINKLIDIMRDVQKSAQHNVKFVVVSQWTSFLSLIEIELKSNNLTYFTIKGDIPPVKRASKVQEFNDEKSKTIQVMLVSLRAGGCGLNLIGGNHLFIMDLHWNPALEEQACDRIYRVGQKHTVNIHKLICKNTVEDSIINLQEYKRGLADQALNTSKLSLQDIRQIFKISK